MIAGRTLPEPCVTFSQHHVTRRFTYCKQKPVFRYPVNGDLYAAIHKPSTYKSESPVRKLDMFNP